MCYGSLDLNTNYNYKKCTNDAARNSIIWRVQNSGTQWLQHYEAALQWNIIPKRLFIRTGVLYNYTKVNLWETIYHHGLYAMGGIVYQHKGFRSQVSFLTSPESIDSQTGKIIHAPTGLDLKASYSIDNWNFSVSYHNPYKAESRAELDLGIYQQDIISRCPYLSDNYGTVTVSYRFNYGKKKHKFDNTQVIDVNQTTISR